MTFLTRALTRAGFTAPASRLDPNTLCPTPGVFPFPPFEFVSDFGFRISDLMARCPEIFWRVRSLALAGLLFALIVTPSSACELCALYGADSALANSSSGFLFTLAEQYTSAHTLQAE